MGEPGGIEREVSDLQRQVTDIAASLVNASPTSIHQVIEAALETAGLHLQADRCTLYLFDPDTLDLSFAYGWVGAGCSPLPLQKLGSIPAEKLFPECLRRLVKHETVAIDDVLNPPAWLGDDAGRIAKLKIRSVLLVPMFAGDLPVGLIGVGRAFEAGSWSEPRRLFLEQIAAFLLQSLLRVKAERVLAQAEARYTALTEYNQSILYELSLDGRYTFLAPNVETALGYRPEELIGKRFDCLMLPDEARRLIEQFSEAVRKKQTGRVYEYRLHHKDGREVWHRSVVAPVRDHTGRATSLVCNALDVTELRHAEAELRREMKLTEILVRLASHYINLPVNQLDMAISRSLQELGEFVKADRAYVFAYDHENGCGKNTHEWCAQGVEPHIDDLQDVPFDHMRDFLEPHLRGQLLYIPEVSSYPYRAARELLESQGIVSLIAMPLMQEDSCVGFVGFDSVKGLRQYSDSEIRLLRVFAEMLVNMLIRTAAQRRLEHEQRRLSEIIDGTDAGTWEWDQQTQAMFFNERFARMIGHDSTDSLPKYSQDWKALVHPQDIATAAGAVVSHLKGQSEHLETELRLQHRKGHWIWLLARGRVVARAEDGRALLVSGIAIDISDRKTAEADLRLAASVFTHSHEGILITDLDARIIDVNEAFSRITGYPREEVLGMTPSILNSGRQTPEFYQEMWAVLEHSGYWSGEIWNRRRDGLEYAQRLTISTVRDRAGRAVRYVGLFSDITDQKQYQHNLERLAHFDALTGLPNRVLLGDRIRQVMSASRRNEQRFALAYIDIDHFKLINDTYGQEVGDQVLLEVASRLQKIVRDSDTVARPGGDEFVVMLTGLALGETLGCMLERLLASVGKPVRIGSLSFGLTASIGVTAYPQSGELEPDQLLRQADQAMYQAKRVGRNGVCYFDSELDRAHHQRQERLRRLHQAFDAAEFVLHYQPKVKLRDGSLAGVEALIRWQHPERGLLPPAEFLPDIEGDPLAYKVAIWVLSSALNQLEAWDAAGLETSVAINVSGSALLYGNLVESLKRELAAHPQLQPERLLLEVVETSMLEDIDKVHQLTNACAELGVRFALDDFGTGFSSLSHLKHLPIRQLKVDRSFVRDMLKDPNDLAIIEGVVRLGQAFDLEVLAEGVETDEHAFALLNLGCELAQGYRIARPMPAVELSSWLQSWQAPAAWAGIPRLDNHDLPLLFAEAECKARLGQIEARFSADPGPGPAGGFRPERSRFRRWLSDRRGEAGYTELWSMLEQVDVLEAEIQQMLRCDARETASQRLHLLQELSECLLADLRRRRSAAEHSHVLWR